MQLGLLRGGKERLCSFLVSLSKTPERYRLHCVFHWTKIWILLGRSKDAVIQFKSKEKGIIFQII